MEQARCFAKSLGMTDLILSPDELVALTGYRRASEQLEELRRQGLWRAHCWATGRRG
jgi:hypothetical protein